MVGLQSGNSPLKFGKGGGGVKKSCRQTTLFVWYHQESNRGHKDFQSFALPTELWHHPVLIYLYINDLRIRRKSRRKIFPCSLLLRIVVSLLFLWKQQGQTLSNGLY